MGKFLYNRKESVYYCFVFYFRQIKKTSARQNQTAPSTASADLRYKRLKTSQNFCHQFYVFL